MSNVKCFSGLSYTLALSNNARLIRRSAALLTHGFAKLTARLFPGGGGGGPPGLPPRGGGGDGDGGDGNGERRNNRRLALIESTRWFDHSPLEVCFRMSVLTISPYIPTTDIIRVF